QANVIWIGRWPYDEAIEKKINSLTRMGRGPLYLSADATDRDSLEQAYRRILRTYPAIHGVVQSAVVLHDQSVARLEESELRASLCAKIDVSVNMDADLEEDQFADPHGSRSSVPVGRCDRPRLAGAGVSPDPPHLSGHPRRGAVCRGAARSERGAPGGVRAPGQPLRQDRRQREHGRRS